MMSECSRSADGNDKRSLLDGGNAPYYGAGNHPSGCDTRMQTYKRRWWTLFLFSLLGSLQCLMWNTWGPITDSVRAAFGWSKPALAMLPNFGNITFCLSAFPMSWIMDTKGLRVATLFSSGMILLGAIARCVSSDGSVLLWTSYLAAMFNGVAGPVPFAGPSSFSATWFPAGQRATSTGVITMAVSFGLASAFLLGPGIVHFGVDDNSTVHNISAQVMDTNSSGVANAVKCGIAGLLFLMVLVYFPAKPPSPPSLSATTNRMKFSKGLLQLSRSSRFWLVNLAYAIPSGTFGAWASVLVFTLEPLGIGQVEAGQIGFYGILLGSVAGLVVARFSDMFSRHLKMLIVVDLVVCVVVMLWVSLMTQQLIAAPKVSIYISVLLVAVTALVPIPLFYELASEICYPVAEGVTVIFMATTNNATGIIYFLLLQIPSIGYAWMTWFLLVTALCAIPLLLTLRTTYSRLNIDSLQADTDCKPHDSELSASDQNTASKMPS